MRSLTITKHILNINTMCFLSSIRQISKPSTPNSKRKRSETITKKVLHIIRSILKTRRSLGQCLQSFFLSEISVDPDVGNPFMSAPLQPILPLLVSPDSCTAFLGHMRLTKGEIRGYMYGSRNFLQTQSRTGMTIQGMHTIVPGGSS